MRSGVDTLSGYTIAVTAARRRDELAALLTRRGARVVLAPTIRIVPIGDDTELRAATKAVLDGPADIVVGTTGIGFRGWLEAADGWGLGEALGERLAASELVARGPKVRAAIRTAGLADAWSPESEAMDEVMQRLLARDLTGVRVVIQLHGDPLSEVVAALGAAGADVVTVPVYRWTLPDDVAPAQRLVEQMAGAEIDAVTFTSAPAVAGLYAVAEEMGRLDAVVSAMRERVTVLAIGPICAVPLGRARVPALMPTRSRLANLARLAEAEVPRRARTFAAAGRRIEVRGHGAVVDGVLVELPPGVRHVLRALAAQPGQVRTHTELSADLPDSDAGALDASVAALCELLGDPALVQRVDGAGYRLTVDD